MERTNNHLLIEKRESIEEGEAKTEAKL